MSFGQQLIQRFSSPEPESEALRKLVWKLAGLRHAHLPRDKARWLELLNDSPFLQGPVGVYADEFAQVGWEVLVPRDRGTVQNALQARAMPAGRKRADLVDDLVKKKELVPVDPDFPLIKILTRNIPRWTGRRLLRMSMIHYAMVGEAFWALGRVESSAPDEALTIVPTDVLETPDPPRPTGQARREGYRLANASGVVPSSEIFEWSNPDPRDIYARGRGVVQALGDEVEGAEWMSREVGAAFRNGNIPRTMFLYRGTETATEFQKKLDRKHRGLNRMYRMFAQRVPSEQLGPVRDQYALEQLGDPLDTAKSAEYARWVWEFIRQYLRVPPSMLANYDDNSGLGQSGVELERTVFLMSVITPLVRDFQDALQDFARREYGGTLIVRHLPFVQTDREFQLRVIEKFEDRYSNDEIRKLSGHSGLEDQKAGEAYLVRKGRIPVESLAPGNEVLEKAAQGTQRQSESSASITAAEFETMRAEILRESTRRTEKASQQASRQLEVIERQALDAGANAAEARQIAEDAKRQLDQIVLR